MTTRSKFFSLVIITMLFITSLWSSQLHAINFPTAKKDIVSELITLKSKNSRLQSQINGLDQRLNEIDNQLRELNQKVIDTEFKLNKQMKVLAKRARAMYKAKNNHSSLQLIFESRTVYELLTRLNFLRLIMKQDLRLLKESKKNHRILVKLKEDYIAKRQKTVTLKQKKQQASNEFKIIRVKLKKKLKIANDKQKSLVNKGLKSADFYDKYLSSQKSPMTGLGASFVAAGRQFGVSPNIVIAIAGVESGFGKHNANSYNAWGRKAKGGGYEWFPSWEVAAFNQTQYLREKYYNTGRSTVASIGAKYAPGNYSWPGKVQRFLDDIKIFRKSAK